MPRYWVALNGVENPAQHFDENSIKNTENIREKFKEKKAPDVLYEEGDRNRGKIIGQDELEPGPIYVWFTENEPWEDEEILQNALFCAEAVYQENPFHHLKGNKSFHSIDHILAAGDYHYMEEDKPSQRCLLSLSENFETKEKMLIVAFKGTETEEQWKDNLTIIQEADNRFLGKFHKGFLKLGNCINIQDILEAAAYYEVQKIVTCGHSLGGAVSSIVHMNLLKEVDMKQKLKESTVAKKYIINITFGSPFFGNEALESNLKEHEFSRNMFHFVSVDDVVPSLLSLGHTYQVVVNAMQRKLSKMTGGLSDVCRQGVNKWLIETETAVNLCSEAIQWYFKRDDKYKESLKSFFHAYKSGESTMQNEYKDNNYVPIGKAVILDNGREVEMLDQGSKIKERVFQAAVEFHAGDPSWENVKKGHSMVNYVDLVKTGQKGFKTFPTRRFKLNKVVMEWGLSRDRFEFKCLCKYSCGFKDCEESPTMALWEQQIDETVFCRNCQIDPKKEEYFYHVSCSNDCESKIHSVQRLRNPTRQVYEESHKLTPMHDFIDTRIVPSSRASYKVALVDMAIAFHDAPALAKWALKYGARKAAKNNAVVAAEVAEGAIARIAPSFLAQSNLVSSLAVFCSNFTQSGMLWWSNKISGRDFIVAGVGHAAEALGMYYGSQAGACAGVKIGACFGGPVGGAWGLCFGGIAGGVVAGILGKMGVKAADNAWKAHEKRGKEQSAEDERARMIVEAMVFLETPAYNEMLIDDVYRCYRRKALVHHPDKLPASATAKDKEDAAARFVILTMARDLLLICMNNPTYMSVSCKNRVISMHANVTHDIGVETLRKGMKKMELHGGALT